MKQRLVNGEHLIWVVDSVADWDAPDSWERERFSDMEVMLKPGMTLFDIGSEHGWCSAIYAKFVGAENVVLFESSPYFWVNIRKTWQANGYPSPKSFWAGLVSNTTIEVPHDLDFDSTPLNGFPRVAWDTEDECPAMSYRYIHSHANCTPQVTIDEFVSRTGIIPDAITMDIEGAELLALQGAMRTIKDHKPLVWVSIHPDLLERDYAANPAQVYGLMENLGYSHIVLAVDHEHHVRFTPR